MTELIQIRKKAQVTLPQSVRDQLGLQEGDFLDVRVQGDEIVLKAKRLVDKEQAWFWTERWQRGERQAEEDIKSGRVKRFASAEDALDELHRKASGTSSNASEQSE